MADPTELVKETSDYAADVNRHDYIIKTSEAMVVGAFAGLLLTTGKIEFMDDIASLISLGIVVQQSYGDNESLTGDGTRRLVARSGIIIKSFAVTGASAITQIGSPVFCTDGQTLTLTKPTLGNPIGYMVNWISSTLCDVYLYTPQEQFSMAQHGIRDMLFIGFLATNSMTATTARDLIKYTAQRHFKVHYLYAVNHAIDNACIAGAQTAQLAIAGTPSTGGLLTLAYTDLDGEGDIGTIKTSTQATALNEIHSGESLTVSLVASGTGFTVDLACGYNVYALVEYMAGA